MKAKNQFDRCEMKACPERRECQICRHCTRHCLEHFGLRPSIEAERKRVRWDART